MSILLSSIREHSRQFVREWDMLKGQHGQAGFSNTQCHALIETGRRGILTVAELADILQLDKSTTSRTVQQLVREGYLHTSLPRTDKRHKPVSLTAKGVAALENLNCEADDRVERALELLSEAEQTQLLQGIELYARALRRSRMQRSFVLRPIRPTDNEAVASIIFRVMTEYGAIGPGYSIQDSEIQAMAEAYADSTSAFFVLEKEGEIFGCGGIAPLVGADPGVCELRKMYFLPETRGLGLGKRFLHLCLDTARTLGYHTCYLETIGSMAQARKLYEATGFVRRDAPLGRTGHFSCDAFMEKKL